MKVYVVMQYKGLEPVGEGTPVDVFLNQEDAEDMAEYYSQDKREHESFGVVLYVTTPAT